MFAFWHKFMYMVWYAFQIQCGIMFKHTFQKGLCILCIRTFAYSPLSVFNISRSGYGCNTNSLMYEPTLIQRTQLTFNEDKHECALTISIHSHQGLYRGFIKSSCLFIPQKLKTRFVKMLYKYKWWVRWINVLPKRPLAFWLQLSTLVEKDI